MIYLSPLVFTEYIETILGYLHSLFLVFSANETFIDKFLWLDNETGNANFCFWSILKTPNLKIRPWNQHPIPSRLAAETQELFRKSPVCTGNMTKDQIGLFSFSKLWKYPSVSTTEGRCHLTVRILCLSVRPWDSSQNREPHGKTVRLGRSVSS